MKSVKHLMAIVAVSIALAACSHSPEELAKQVRANMEEKFRGKGITVKSLVLTKKGGNEYAGVLETQESNGDFTYTVQVIYDGNSFTWQIVQ